MRPQQRLRDMSLSQLIDLYIELKLTRYGARARKHGERMAKIAKHIDKAVKHG